MFKNAPFYLGLMLLLFSSLSLEILTGFHKQVAEIEAGFKVSCRKEAVYLTSEKVVMIDYSAFENDFSFFMESYPESDWSLVSYKVASSMVYPVFVSAIVVRLDFSLGQISCSHILNCTIEKGTL